MKKFFSFLLLGLLLSIGNVWAGYEKASSIAIGDQVVFVYETTKMELTSISITSTTYGIGASYDPTPQGTWTFDVVAGSANNTFAFKSGDNYLAWTSGNSLTTSTTLNSNSSWAVSFENGNAIILNAQTATRKLQWNSSSPRFACYTSNQSAIQLYKMVNASVAAPVFSPAEGSFFETQNVSITCPTEGAAIYYTLDGSDPTSESTLYVSPIEVSETKTIKAIAIVGNESSSIASATYTIVTQKTIAEVRAQATGSILTHGVVTSSSSDGKTVYIQDATAGVVVYSTSDLSLTIGDEITVRGTLSNYNGLLEITSPVVNVLSQGNSVSPIVKTIAEINADNTYALQGLLIKIEDATVSNINGLNVTIAQSANTIVVRFASAADLTAANIEVNNVITLVGNIGCYNGAQIANPTDVQIAVNEDPSIEVSPNSIEATSDEKEGTIAIEHSNITISQASDFAIQYYDAEDAVIEEPDWIVSVIEENNGEYEISYIIEANNGDARTAYMKVFAFDEEDNVVYSELITISQAAYVAPAAPADFMYVKVTATELITDGQYLIVYEGNATHDAFAFDGSRESLDAASNGVAVTIVEGIISGSSELEASEFTIDVTAGTILSASEYFIGRTANSNGLDANKNNQYENTFSIDEDGNAVITASGGCTLRYNYASDQLRFRYYKTGQQAIALYKRCNLVLGANGFSTYAADEAFTVSGATAYKAHYDAQAGTVVLTEVTGVIPAEEGIILKGEEGAPVVITPSAEEPLADFSDNGLIAVLEAETAPTNAYALATIDNDNVTKFHPCTGIEIPAHKAYIVIEDAPSSAPIRIVFAENGATGIKDLDGSEKAVKFIENGKFYIMKNGVVFDATGRVVK